MSAALQNAKGPARIAVLPSHGPNNPEKEMKMNDITNNMPEHPWEAVRRMTKDLSAMLDHVDRGTWFATILPGAQAKWEGFGRYPQGPSPDEYPVDKVNRLAWELAEALNEYQGGRYQARIYPSDQAGNAVMFVVTSAAERRDEA